MVDLQMYCMISLVMADIDRVPEKGQPSVLPRRR
jgi:hypothetical protein